MLTLRQIEVFRAFMVTGTVSDAARLLGVSQPSISTILLHIQDRLQVRLYHRVRGRLLPTPEAMRLLDEIQNIWDGIERVRLAAADLRQGLPEILRIAASPSLGVDVLPPLITALRTNRPKVRIKLELLTPLPLMRSLLEGRTDIGFNIPLLEDPGLITETAGQIGIFCVVPQIHDLAKLKQVSLEDVAKYPLVMHSQDQPERRLVEELFSARGLFPDSSIHVQSGQSACRFVKAGAGIALVDGFTARDTAFADLRAIPLAPAAHMDVCVVWSANRPLGAAASELQAAITKQLSD